LIYKKLIVILLCINYMYAINIGTISIKNDDNLISMSKDIQKILKKYKINSKIQIENNSLDSIEKLINNKTNNYFAIVNYDSILEYNNKKSKKYGRSIYRNIPVILTLGSEQLHIFTNENNEFEFDIKKEYSVYCGKKDSDSCISAKYIEKVYGFIFTYKKSNIKEIQSDLQNNKIELFISVKKAPYKGFLNFKNIKLVDLPTNFKMEDIYLNSQLKTDTYTFLDEDMHIYGVNRVLITNIKDKKYDALIKNMVKIIMLNKNYLDKNNKIIWEDVDFMYFRYKKFSKVSKNTIIKIDNKIRHKNALKF